MGRARIIDPDTERPPDVRGLPLLDQRAATASDDATLPQLTLPFELRARSRLRARLDDGREVAVVLPRGSVLRDGAVLTGTELTVRVVAADEDLVEVRAADPGALARVAYHLGNRHVPVQVLDDRLLLAHDSVLVDLLVRMGARLRRHWARFEPEAGAYGGQGDEGAAAHHHG